MTIQGELPCLNCHSEMRGPFVFQHVIGLGRRLPLLPPAPRLEQPEHAPVGPRRPALPLVPLADGRPEDLRFAAAVLPRPHVAALPQLHDLPRRGPRFERVAAAPEVEADMRKARRRSSPSPLAAGGCSQRRHAPRAQAIPVDLELGYRFVDVSGNDQMYRTQINDRPGVLLRSLDYTGPERSAAASSTTLHVDASDIGAGPGRAAAPPRRRRTSVFKLTFTWRETDLYSALPAFANPFLDDGIIPGQQTWNRTRNIYDAELELLPGQDHHAPPRLHAQRLRRPGHHDVPPRRERVPARTTRCNSVDELYRRRPRLQLGPPSRPASPRAGAYYRWQRSTRSSPGAGDGNVTHADPRPGRPRPTRSPRTENNKVNTPVTNAWVTGTSSGASS